MAISALTIEDPAESAVRGRRPRSEPIRRERRNSRSHALRHDDIAVALIRRNGAFEFRLRSKRGALVVPLEVEVQAITVLRRPAIG
jgi:hypothetical protein